MYERMMAGRSRRRSLMESASPVAGWNTLLCSASDGNEGGEGGEGGGGGNADDAIKRILAKNEELLAEAKAAKARARELEAAEAERKADIARKEEETAREKGEWSKIEEGWKSKHSEAEGNALLWKSKYLDRELDLGLTQALDAANVKPELRKAAMALLKSNAEVDDDGNVTLGDKPLAEAITAWAKSDEGKAFVANGSSGGGANGGGKGGSGDKNPWAKDSFNLTEQGKIYKADPARARELAKAAGAVPPA